MTETTPQDILERARRALALYPGYVFPRGTDTTEPRALWFPAEQVVRIIAQALLAERKAQREKDAGLEAAMWEAIETLYHCRYSEKPLAEKLDAMMKERTGQSYHERIMEAAIRNQP